MEGSYTRAMQNAFISAELKSSLTSKGHFGIKASQTLLSALNSL